MALLDLQGMKVQGTRAKAPSGSRTSKGCGNTTQSNTSLILCTLTL
jgi:hypothetical protein